MTDTNMNVEAAEVTEAEAAEVDTDTDTDDEFNLEAVTRKFFDPAKLEGDAMEYVARIQGLPKSEKWIKYNFDPAGEFPANCGLAVLPLSERQDVLVDGKPKGKNVTIGVAIAAVPTLEAVSENTAGEHFMRRLLADHCFAKLANAFRPKKDGQSGTAPRTLEDFMSSMRGGEGLKTYTTLAPDFVKALRDLGMKWCNQSILRSVLQSAPFAASKFGRIEQTVWVAILDRMIKAANEKGLDPKVLEDWKENRDQAELQEVDAEDILSAIEGLTL